MFEAIDKDGSGDLDHEEFTTAMNRLGLGLTPAQVRATAILGSNSQIPAESAQKRSQPAEWFSVRGPQINQCIEVLDKDGDGEVSYAEFMELVKAPVKKAVNVISAANAFGGALSPSSVVRVRL